MKQTLEEKETHFNISANDRNRVHIGTDDQVWINRLNQWFAPTKVTGEWHEYNLPVDLVIRETAIKNGTKRLERYSRAKHMLKTNRNITS